MLGAIVFFVEAASGEDQPAVELEPVLVTARGRTVPARLTPGGVGVIESDDLIARDVTSLSDLLSLVPGAARTADAPWGADINIRGLSRDAVIVLIDGCRVNTATDIGARLGMIAPEDIERIEILKGPISALYGSGSMGGVVNVITRGGRFADPPESTGRFSGRASDNPSGYSLFGAAGNQAPDASVYASQSYRDFDAYEDGNGERVRNSQFSDLQTHIRAGYRPSEALQTSVNIQYFEGNDIGIPGSGTAPLPAAADVTYPSVRRVLVGCDSTYRPGTAIWRESALAVYYQSLARRVRIDGFPETSPQVAVFPGADHETVGARWQNTLDMEPHTLVCGIDAWQRDLDAWRVTYRRSGEPVRDDPLPTSEFGSAGAFATDDWSLSPDWTLSAGGRADSLRVANDETELWSEREERDASWSLHMGATWQLSSELSMKWLGASGYRSPSLEERYQYLQLGGGRVKIGDPDLDSERSAFFEYGAGWQGARAMAGVSVFYNELRDMIGERVVDEQTVVNANVEEARIHGCEAEARWAVSEGCTAYGNLSWAVGRDTRNSRDLANIAPLSGLCGMACHPGRGFWGRVETEFAARQDQTPEGIPEAPGWASVDVRIGRDLSSGSAEHTVYAGVDNVLDKAYRDYLSTSRGTAFNEPGRSLVVGYEVAF